MVSSEKFIVNKGLLMVFNYIDSNIQQDDPHNNFIKYLEAYNFSPVLHAGQTKSDLINKLVSRDDIEDYDCIMVMISSQSTELSVICSDGEIKLNEIIDIFNEKIPIQIPKLLFIQSFFVDECDGNRAVSQNNFSAIETDRASTVETLPSDANLLVVHSIMENNSCSWFIDCLIKVFENYSESEDLMTMLTRVNREMKSSQKSQLTHKIFLKKL